MKTQIKRAAAFLTSVITALVFITPGFEGLNFISEISSVSAEENIPDGYTPIRTIEDLYGINNDLSGKYILMNDIDMTEDTAPGGDWDINGTGWEPIGAAEEEAFNGIFDGNGCAIIGMNIHGELQYYSVGLFSINDGEIKNLKLIDVNFNITSVESDWASSCSAVGAICGGNGFENRTYSYGEITSCFVSGEINVNDMGYSGGYVGGLVGYSTSDMCYNIITDCYNLADINTKDEDIYIGGICGYNDTEIVNCYNAGNLTGKKISAISNNDYYECYSLNGCRYLTGTCEEQESVSGKCQAMSVAQMKSQSAFTGWDFESTWVIDSTSSYKYPQLRSCMQVPVTEVSLVSAPEKAIYNSGDSIVLAGSKILVKHEDGSSGEINIDKSMLGEYNMKQIGKQSIIINYIGKSTMFDIMIYLKGDANGDEKIDLYDAIDIAKYLIGMRDYTYEEEIIADYNNDGKVDLYDAIGIAKYLLNNI